MSEDLVSPVVNSDRSVTFKFKSAHAKSVEIVGELKFEGKAVGPGAPAYSAPMKKASNNVWTYKTKALLPGIYRYVFIVDGTPTLDPLNPWRRYPVSQEMSMIKVKGDEPMPWDPIPDISHGTVVIEKFYCETLRMVKSCAVYLPPGYMSTKKTYPVLYLLHGRGDDYGSWVLDGNADNMMDFLISKKKVKETVVVMPDGHVRTPEETREIMAAARREIPSPSRSSEFRREVASERHANYFVKDLMPFIESRYRVLRQPGAIAGLSMGGAQTLNLIASHPDKFKAAGMFGSGPADWVTDKLPQVRGQLKRFKLFYVSCGNWDFLLETSRGLHRLLDKLKIRHVYVEGEGGHIWSFWQRSLVDFVSKINAS